jgi:hypothetical protein
MSLQPDTDLTIFIRQDGKELLTDTRAVAIAFGKQHKIVMRNIDAMLASSRACIAGHARLDFESRHMQGHAIQSFKSPDRHWGRESEQTTASLTAPGMALAALAQLLGRPAAH